MEFYMTPEEEGLKIGKTIGRGRLLFKNRER